MVNLYRAITLHPIPKPNSKPLNRLTFDYLGPLTPSNRKKYILVATCNTTKYIFTKVVESAAAEATVKFLIEIISRWGCFQNVSSDQSTHFKTKLVTDICDNKNDHINKLFTPNTGFRGKNQWCTVCNFKKLLNR